MTCKINREIKLEICVDSIDSAIAAAEGGAHRIELCSSLSEGGLTPSAGLFQVVKAVLHIPVFVMIRPRSGDFLYSNTEIEIMKEDIKVLRKLGADGFVFGCLKRDGRVDTAKCHELIEFCRQKPVTFHRAIDWTPDLNEALEDIISCGFNRILTSGGTPTAAEGLQALKSLVNNAKERIIIMAGSGISYENLSLILSQTGIKEVHSSASSVFESNMTYRKLTVRMGSKTSLPELSLKRTESAKVAGLLSICMEII